MRGLDGAVAQVRGGGARPVAEIAWVVGTPWQGRGFAREAAVGLVGWLADQRVGSVIAHVRPGHDASAAVARAAGLAPTIPLDDQLRPQWLFGKTVHEGCDRAAYYEQADFAHDYNSPKCQVKIGCWGPVVNCNVTKRGWMDGVGKGQKLTLTYVPNEGTHVQIGGKDKGVLPGKATADAILATWIGPDPGPGKDFKKAVLGS